MDETDFTPDELAFISSRGSDTAALDRAYGGDTKPEGDETKQAPKADDEPKQVPDDDDDDDDDGHRSETVPHGRFHKERARRQAAQKEAEELRVKMARAEERLAILNEFALRKSDDDEERKPAKQNGAANPKSALDEPDIDPMQDFAGAMEQLRRRQSEMFQKQNDFMEQTRLGQEKQQERDREREHAQSYASAALQFQQKEPTFKDAYAHLMRAYHSELTAYGMTDVNQRNEHIKNEEKKLARWAIENKRNPAEVLYQVAQTRGFKKPATNTNNGDTEDDAPENKQVVNKIRTIDKGQKATASLSNAGGGAKNSLTMDSILNMSDDEFYEKVHKLAPSKRKKLLGGY